MRTSRPLRFVKSLFRIVTARPQVPASLEDNQLLQVILSRRSVRRFGEREIPDDAFAAILEAGRLAPSTVNLQTWAFATFTPGSWRETFGAGIPFKARRAVIVMGDTHRDKMVLDVFPYSPLVEYTIAVMNASLAAMNMNIAAEALGISSAMLSETGRSGFLDAGYLREKLALPNGLFPIMTIVFGYARGKYLPMPPKLSREQVCFEGTYREADRAMMEEWMSGMVAGYKATQPLSSFEKQVEAYKSKIGKAEDDLRAMIYYGDAPAGLE